jgi:hypothetical protein
MELDQLLHQRQPDARPLLRAPSRVFDPVEPLEDSVDLLGRNADSRIADGQLHGLPAGRRMTAMSPSKVNLKALDRS